MVAAAVPGLPLDDPADRRRLRWALGIALSAHLLLLLLPFPQADARSEPDEPEHVVTVLNQVRLVERPPEPEVPQTPPEEPPIRVPVPEIPVAEEPELRPVDPLPVPAPTPFDTVVLPPPPAPPAPETVEPIEVGPIPVGGAVARPRAIFTPKPGYTEAARRLRFEGTGIFQLILDPHGEIAQVDVLRPVPLGLTEQALGALRQWRYEPATLNGKAVAVSMTVTIHFTLQ